MKSKKILSLVLAVVMLFTCTSLITSAVAPEMSFTKASATTIKKGQKIDKANFGVKVIVDKSGFCAIDGESEAYTTTVDSITVETVDANDVVTLYDYNKDPDAFFAVLEDPNFAGTTLKVSVKFDFESNKVFGNLNYVVVVDGFTEKAKTDIPPIDDKLPDVQKPIKIEIKENIEEFPHATSVVLNQAPAKQEYKDNEHFDLTGVQVQVTTPTFTGVVTHNAENDKMFTCIPSKNDKLTVDTKEVYTYFDGVMIGIPTAIKVDHAMSDYYVNITTNKYTDKDPGYHAKVCDGCGLTHDAQPHEVDPNVPWESDNNATFVENGTEHNYCTVCGAKLTRDVFHSAGYEDAFAELHFLNVIFDYINALLRIIRSAIGKF